jgi:tyrosyl-tRNA synthetase
MDIFEDLKFRGLIYQISNEKNLKEKFKKEKIVLYCGFDPTAPSLHVGNLLQLLALKRFQKFGHFPIALLGGGTALIGDPSGKDKERPLLDLGKIETNKSVIKKQIERILEKRSYKILDNSEWLLKIDLISFLRNYGKHFQVAQMLAKESVKKRISTAGISFCEFSYMILQAIDFLELKKRENCDLQIGGSDQWGNITCGIDLIKKVLGVEVFGLTFPLITTKTGKKFGKTEKGAVFLEKNLTSPYEFYQFWINIDDADVIKFLKYFTLLSKEEILELAKKTKENPKEREAQKVLAREVTKLVHGEKELKRVERISQILFYGNVRELKEEEIKEALFNVPTQKIPKKEKIPAIELLVLSEAAKSKSEAKRLIKQKGVEVNGTGPISSIEQVFSDSDALFGKYFVIKKGKRRYFLVEFEI